MSISATAAGPEMVGRLTENGNRIGEFTVGGTIGLVVFVGLFGGLAGSVVVVATDPWLRWAGPLKGLGFGVAAMAIFGYDTFASVDFRILDPVSLNVAMFLGLMVAFGFTVIGVNWLLDRRLPPAGGPEQPGYLVLVALGALPLFIAVLFFTLPSFCGCDPAYEIGAAVLVMVASTVIHHASKVTEKIPAWLSRAATIAGYSSLVLALVFGLNRTIENIQDLF